MNNKTILITVIIIIFIGLIVGIAVNIKGTQQTPNLNNSPLNISDQNTSAILPTLTKGPEPTFPPYDLRVTSISDVYINLTNDKGGTLRLDINKTKILKRESGKLITASVEDVKIGQFVTVKIIVAGKEAQLIIER